jgi:general stress protein YciG
MAQNKSQGPGSGTSNRGFASMDEQKQREIASKGGRSVAAQDRSFSQDRELAAQAGRKGGQASHGGRGAQRRGAASAGARKTDTTENPTAEPRAGTHNAANSGSEADSGSQDESDTDADTRSEEGKGNEH